MCKYKQSPGYCRLYTSFEWDEETKILSVTPPRWNAAGISSIDLDENDPGYSPTTAALFEKGELKDWGNLPRYYMVQYVDTAVSYTHLKS